MAYRSSSKYKITEEVNYSFARQISHVAIAGYARTALLLKPCKNGFAKEELFLLSANEALRFCISSAEHSSRASTTLTVIAL